MTAATAVRERPILFSGPMVRALLDGSKTQTRRVVVPQPSAEVADVIRNGNEFVAAYPNRSAIRPSVYAARPRYGLPGDRLWVRETWSWVVGNGWRYVYRADGPPRDKTYGDVIGEMVWKPSIRMPRRLSRIALELTDVRVERLQAITAEGAIAEGIPSRGIEPPCIASAIMYLHDFEQLWNGINAKRGFGWDVNPWVWVLSFRRVEP